MANRHTGPDPLKSFEKVERQAARSTVLAKRAQLSPAEISRIRVKIAKNVEDYLPIVDEVIRGTRDFSPTQARIFTALLNKVVPDLSATLHKHEPAEKDLNRMSLAELEEIAAGVASARANMIDPDDIVEGAVISSATTASFTPHED